MFNIFFVMIISFKKVILLQVILIKLKSMQRSKRYANICYQNFNDKRDIRYILCIISFIALF